MITTVTYETKIFDGKPLEMKTTRMKGVQQIEVDGEMITVGELMITESRLGTCRIWTRDPRGAVISPEAQENCRAIAAKAMTEQGLW